VELPNAFRLFLLLQAAVEARDEDATRLALREAAETLDDRDSQKVAGLIGRTVPGSGRNWLSRL